MNPLNFPGSGLYERTAAERPGVFGAEARYVIPRFVERTSQGVREYDPYAKLFEERVIFLGVQIDDASANDVMAQLLCLESMDPDRDISVYINSPGGSFTALTAIYDTMQFVKPDIQTVCMGQAASAAAVLLAAGSPGKRMALPNARVLIHQPYSETGRGQVSDLEIAGQRDHPDAPAAGGDARQALHHADRADPRRHRAGQDPHRRGVAGLRSGRPDRVHPQDVGVVRGGLTPVSGPPPRAARPTDLPMRVRPRGAHTGGAARYRR